MSALFLLRLLLVLQILAGWRNPFVSAQVSSAASNEHLPANEFTEAETFDIEEIVFGKDLTESPLSTSPYCPIPMDIVWSNHLDTSLVASPLIFDGVSSSLSQKYLLIPAFQDHLNILDSEGVQTDSSPFVSPHSPSFFHASPLLLDFNGDGIDDFVWVSSNAEVYIFNGANKELEIEQSILKIIHLRKLKVQKDWWKTGEVGVYNSNTRTNRKGRSLLTATDEEKHENLDGLTKEARDSAAQLDEYFGEEDSEEESTEQGKRAKQHGIIDDYTDDTEQEEYPAEEGFVWVDSHVLASCVLFDVNGDGKQDLIVPLSHFFEAGQFETDPHLYSHLPSDINIENYVAGLVAAVDLSTGKFIWSHHLDLSTMNTKRKAFLLGSPTVIDLEGKGNPTVVIGTGFGLIYLLDAKTGKLRSGFPLQMDEIQTQISGEDINDDGAVELIAIDIKGNVLCFNGQAEAVWKARISGFPAQAPSFGDINGDGIIDIVTTTVAGHVYALSGNSGEVLPHFPLRADGRIVTPVTLANLDITVKPYLLNPSLSDPFQDGLHVIFGSFDGNVYIVDGRSGCTNKIDIGERPYGQILVDDLQGRDKMDLLLTTMNGNVFCLGTDSPFHPLKTWRSQAQSRNVFSSRSNHHGVYFSHSTKAATFQSGRDFEVEFTIVDNRGKYRLKNMAVQYNVSIFFSGKQVFSQTYDNPGMKKERIISPPEPGFSLLKIQMVNEHSQLFEDTFSLSINQYYYRIIKYLIILPVILVCSVAFLSAEIKQELPTM